MPPRSPGSGECFAFSSLSPLAFSLWSPPEWASAWGQDELGPFVAIRVGDVEQRLRWIPPGWLTTGSPDDEPARNDVEGPRQRVTFTQGFWLFQTPCTPELWEAVMGIGKTPGEIASRRPPVEQLSGDAGQRFIERAEQLVPGLRLALPTDVEWEYARTAGSLREPSNRDHIFRVFRG